MSRDLPVEQNGLHVFANCSVLTSRDPNDAGRLFQTVDQATRKLLSSTVILVRNKLQETWKSLSFSATYSVNKKPTNWLGQTKKSSY